MHRKESIHGFSFSDNVLDNVLTTAREAGAGALVATALHAVHRDSHYRPCPVSRHIAVGFQFHNYYQPPFSRQGQGLHRASTDSGIWKAGGVFLFLFSLWRSII